MTEERPRFDGDIEDTYAEVEAVGELGDKQLRIELGVPGSKYVVYLSGEELGYFAAEVYDAVSEATNIASEDTACRACGCYHIVSTVRWYTKETFEDHVMGSDGQTIQEFCGSPTEFPVALCGDCICPK